MLSTELLTRGQTLPDHEVVRLLMAATDCSRTDVIVGFDVSTDQIDRFDAFVRRRLADEPLQYIEGSVPFGPVDLIVDDRVLIPRPETEHMFEIACKAVESPAVIVDLCCGSGNLALALAATFSDAKVYAVDLSESACEVAAANAERNGLTIEILHGDLFEPLPRSLMGKVDLLVANPPYLAEHEFDDLPKDVLEEPKMALLGGVRGDEIIARIASGACRWLAPDGSMFCEVSEFSTDRTLAHFVELGAEVQADLAGRPRFVTGRRS